MINKKRINKMITIIIAALVGCAASEATETKTVEPVATPVVETAPAAPETVVVPTTEATATTATTTSATTTPVVTSASK